MINEAWPHDWLPSDWLGLQELPSNQKHLFLQSTNGPRVFNQGVWFSYKEEESRVILWKLFVDDVSDASPAS